MALFKRIEEPEDEVVLSLMDRRIKPRRITRKRILVFLLTLTGLLLTISAYFNYGKVESISVDREHLVISTVANGTFLEYIPVTGNIEPQNIVYLDAIEGGQVMEVIIEEGAIVTAGQPLVVLKNTNLQLEVIGREAQLTEQINNLNNTRLSFEQNRLQHKRDLIDLEAGIQSLTEQIKRREKLINIGSVTAEQLADLSIELNRKKRMREAVIEAQKVDEEFQESQIEQLNSAIAKMNRNLDIARENLNSLVVKAPISGQLTTLDAHVGESKSKGQRIGQIDKVDEFKVSAYIDEFYLSRVKVGQQATVEIDNKEYFLRVSKVYPEVTDRQFDVDLVFINNPPETIRRGQSLQLKLNIGAASQTLILDNGSFYDATGGNWAFVLDDSGDIAERKFIKLGRRTPQSVEVIEGLKQGDRVITSGYENFTKIDRIHIY